MGKERGAIPGGPVDVIVDRPMGSRHPAHPEMAYPVNYGYVPGVMAADGEEQDVYILGVDGPLERFSGRVVAVIHRLNDVEDKWVAAPEGVYLTREEIRAQTHFQEQYFDTWIELRDMNGSTQEDERDA